jgi:FkbM family methyltransferase
MMSDLFDLNGLSSIDGGVLHLGAHEAEEMGFYESRDAKFVVWVEANPDMEALLRSKMRAGHDLVVCAVMDVDGEADLRLYSHADNNSVLARGQDQPPVVFETGVVRVPSMTVDTIVDCQRHFNMDDCRVLVMDVQGAELLALKGADRFLRSPGLTHVCLEVIWSDLYVGSPTETELVTLLRGYRFVPVDRYCEGDSQWGNIMFRRSSH